jgi:predicted peptidase
MFQKLNAQNKTSRQTEESFEKEIKLRVGLKYLLYLPSDYDKSDKAFPLVLFLHGAEERGSDIEAVKRHGTPMLIEEGHDSWTETYNNDELYERLLSHSIENSEE